MNSRVTRYLDKVVMVNSTVSVSSPTGRLRMPTVRRVKCRESDGRSQTGGYTLTQSAFHLVFQSLATLHTQTHTSTHAMSREAMLENACRVCLLE